MKTFSDKVREARRAIGLTQEQLGEKIGITKRSVIAYENAGVRPRGNVLRNLAAELQVSVDYLLNDEIDDPMHGIEKGRYMEEARALFGERAATEVGELLEKNTALFAGGSVSQEAKDAFFEAVMKAYITCKEESRKTYGRKRPDNLDG